MGAKILIIDHNDSFTYNLVGLFESVKEESGQRLVASVDVWAVNELPVKDLQKIHNYEAVVLSPGPGLPKDYPAVFQLLQHCLEAPRQVPVLGICLGLQSLVTFLGGALYNLSSIQHGQQVDMVIDSSNKALALFDGLAAPLKVGLYHSWAMDTEVAVPDLEILATAIVPEKRAEGKSSRSVVMALSHKRLPIYGLQFHPESYMTPQGDWIIRNWLHTIAKQ